jgi:two-component system cell cycle response regulator
MSVRLRFNLILLAICSLGLMGSAAYYERESDRLAREAVEFEARLHMQTALAVRQYTIERVKPQLEANADAGFALGAVPAFAARETLTRLFHDYPGYRYREAALAPTNPINSAAGWERTLIEHYRDGSVRGDQVSVIDEAHGRTLHLARPIVVNEPACLRCHGDPAHAPQALRALYPSGGGFNWRLGEIVGAHIVSVPFELQQRRAAAAYRDFLVALAGAFALLFVALNVLLSRMVLQPLNDANAALNRLADTDALTGAHNRRSLDRRLQRSLGAARARRQPVSLVAFDLDHFKQINDRFGHEAGDKVLKRASSVVLERLRHNDVLARVGGEEFIIVLPETSADSARRVAESLREQLAAALVSRAGEVTASFGVTQWDGREAPQALLARADQALYAAKRGGRNRVEVL